MWKGKGGLREVSGSGRTRSGGGTERTGNGKSYHPLDNSPMLAGLYIPERLTTCVTSKRGRNVPLKCLNLLFKQHYIYTNRRNIHGRHKTNATYSKTYSMMLNFLLPKYINTNTPPHKLNKLFVCQQCLKIEASIKSK